MKHIRWYLFLAVALVGISAIFYLIQVAIFHRTEDTFFYMLQDIAFVPDQVLLVTLFLNQLLTMREKRALLKKMNMLIGTFYIEVGSDLMKQLYSFGSDLSSLREEMLVTGKWTEKDFMNARTAVKNAHYGIDSRIGNLSQLKIFLSEKRPFLLSLLANPNLLEHDAFTDLLWAVFHLVEELAARQEFTNLPKSDFDHLSGDIKRAYSQLLVEWLAYMKHLKDDYPYLFSLAVRMNPMDVNADPVVK